MISHLTRFGIVIAGCVIATAAAAGDFAERRILGFSPDGAYFAFEEFGIQDGSGLPYSNIFVVETQTDRWAPGSPIRVRLDVESYSTTQVRGVAMRKARDLLQALAIGEAGRLVASNPPTEVNIDPHTLTFRSHPYAGISSTYRLDLEEIVLPAKGCPDFGEKYHGFRLRLTGPDGTRLLVDDTRIPDSRRCPLRYGISDVIAYHPKFIGEPLVIVILVNVFSVGFEGPDRRFLAIATRP